MAYKMIFQHGPAANNRRKLENPFIQDYCYLCTKTCGETMYLKCKNNCGAIGQLVDGVLTLTVDHNHPSSPLDKLIYEFENALYEGVITRRSSTVREIYDDISLNHSIAATNLPWLRMKKKLQKWRKKTRPPAPRTWLDYLTLLSMATWASFTQYEGGRLDVTMIRAMDNSVAIIYTDREFLERIQTHTLYMDATFRVIPPKPKTYQFFTIMAEVNHAAIPIFWALMKRKTGPAYSAVLSYFHHLAPHIHPTLIMSDFEDAIAIAIEDVYPGVSHKRCFFHFLKALRARAKALGLFAIFQQWPYGKILYRKICALALLPADLIEMTFNWLIRTRMHNIPQWREFIKYFTRQWIRNVNPGAWSVFGLNNRTNNYIESYHRILGLKFGKHPSIWDFTASLRNLVITTKREFTSMQMGYLMRENPGAATIAFQRAIHKAWEFLTNDTFNIPSFLNCAVAYLRIFNPYPLIDLNNVDQFINCDPRNIHNMNTYECPFCEQRVSNIASLPCNHVYSCVECAVLHQNTAIVNNEAVYCFCGEIVNELRQIF